MAEDLTHPAPDAGLGSSALARNHKRSLPPVAANVPPELAGGPGAATLPAMMRLCLWSFLALLALPAWAQDAIGRVNAAGFKTLRQCSGTLVAPDRVLTAAHCLVRRDGAPVPLGDFVFVAGWDGAGHAGAAEVTEVTLHPEALSEDSVVLQHDLALLTLATPLDITPLPVGRASSQGPFELRGYPRSAPHRLAERSDCAGEPIRGVWRLGCAIEQGFSGGPVLAGDGDTLRVVAVLSAINQGRAVAVPVDDWLIRTLAGARPSQP
ncbi:trypsin-like serine peptidase [Litorisediminicola beolgyonensis]|uniref:Trypsin-like serine peptidase n=1 Tax=Litorisediminicola beolgyonensis TaxID=1173614 RepID=A0ABW3ZHC0_9RHOB